MTRTFVMGDPQGPFDKVKAVLARHGALAGSRIAPDVVLVSIGDHFDYNFKDPEPAGREGVALLRWLASHEPEQVHILLGNHDASRVMELATITDEEFSAARTCPPDDFAARYPHLPPHGVIARDYASFSVEQRELVRELLVARRFHLALVGELGGRQALITHAGVTTRELALLGVAPDPRALARALEAHLERAVAAGTSPLSLEPLHVAGGAGLEGGGLLYHRPSATPPPDPARPRRFDPRTLPEGLLQIAGHSGHAKCVHELGDWCTWRAQERKHGGLRTLRADPPSYDLGVDPTGNLILIDGELRRVPADEVDLLEISGVAVLA